MATVANLQARGDLQETWRTRDVRAQHNVISYVMVLATVVARRQNSVLRAAAGIPEFLVLIAVYDFMVFGERWYNNNDYYIIIIRRLSVISAQQVPIVRVPLYYIIICVLPLIYIYFIMLQTINTMWWRKPTFLFYINYIKYSIILTDSSQRHYNLPLVCRVPNDFLSMKTFLFTRLQSLIRICR